MAVDGHPVPGPVYYPPSTDSHNRFVDSAGQTIGEDVTYFETPYTNHSQRRRELKKATEEWRVTQSNHSDTIKKAMSRWRIERDEKNPHSSEAGYTVRG